MRRLALCVAVLFTATLLDPGGAAAQQRRQSPPRRAARAEMIRSEYAAVLLQTKRYEEAAREYRTLIATDTSNPAYPLGLARALAWGGHPSEAEPILRRLASQRSDTAVARLLIEVRLAGQPSASEALAWVRESPRNDQYRLALARAYVRERRFLEAFASFDTLLAASATVPLLREAAGAHAAARDSTGNAALLERALALAGYDAGLRREYAAALVWSGNRSGAIAEYTSLLRASPHDPELLLERGRLYAWSGDYPAAERDLAASLAGRPSREAYALLGDVYRWQGDRRRSRQAYAAVLALAPGDSSALAGLAALERDRAAVVALGMPADAGWSAQFTHSEDNAGFLYLASGIARGFELGRRTTVGAAVEQRRIAARSSRAAERYVYGFALSGRAVHRFDRATAGVMAGVARHGVVRDIAFGEIRLTAGGRNGSVNASVSRGPVYLPLVSAQSLVEFNGNGVLSTTPLVGRGAQLGGSMPIGAVTVTASGEVTSLSDGNRRTSGYLGAAYPVAPRLSFLYSGFALGYTGRSERYWDPMLYNSHSVGVQYALRGGGPLSLTARVLSGVGRATEIFPTRDGPSIRATGRAALQLAGSGEMSYRRGSWELAATAGYARGREGAYQSLNSTLRLRLMR